jgi:carboxylate-amine ligase
MPDMGGGPRPAQGEPSAGGGRRPALEHVFGSGRPFTVGLEEELLLVEAGTLQLAHVAHEVLPRIKLPPGRADHEAFLAELELRSTPCTDARRATGQLGRARAAARAAGATLLAAGVHPNARLGDVRLVASERYERVAREMRGLIRRTPECALHVHVGMPDTEAACAALTALREALPLLQGLAANSPFWFGVDSGMASARSAVVRAYPGRGAPPPLRSWSDYVEALDATVAGGGPKDPAHTMIWWDVRLQPRLGTVEMRELDVQARLDDSAALAALVRALARRAAESPLDQPAPGQAIAWSWFRASRDGLDAEIMHDGRLQPLRSVTREVLASLDDDEPALEGVERILREGNGADRQRAAHDRGGMSGVLRHLVEETARPYGR